MGGHPIHRLPRRLNEVAAEVLKKSLNEVALRFEGPEARVRASLRATAPMARERGNLVLS